MSESGGIDAFIVGEAAGPHQQSQHPGLLRYYLPVTLIPVGPLEDLKTELSVVVTRLWRIGLSGGPGRVDTPEGKAALAKRLWYWVVEQIPSIVDQLRAGEGVELRPTEADLDRLTKVVPDKFVYAPETPIPLAARRVLPRQVFISCGQVTAAEIALGKAIEKAVSELPGFRGYFAQNQNSLAGVTDHILKALHGSAVLVGVMHGRGEVTGPAGSKSQRGSVWIEQEIAIAAFMEQVLDRRILVRLYCEKGIAVEGLRGQILVHAVPFENPEDILTDLRDWLRTLRGLASLDGPP
jgi:hypothetical protein